MGGPAGDGLPEGEGSDGDGLRGQQPPVEAGAGAAACGWALLEHWSRWAPEPLTAEQRLLRALWTLAGHGERSALARTFLRAFGGREER